MKSQGTKSRITVKAPVSGPLSLEAGHSHANTNQIDWNVNCKYIVIGIIGNEESIPHVILLPILTREDLFKHIRKAERKLRFPFRRLLSLKRVRRIWIVQMSSLSRLPQQPRHQRRDYTMSS